MNFFKNLWFSIRLKRQPRLTDSKTKKFIRSHNQHDNKLVQKLTKNKRPSVKQLKYIHKIFTVKEKLIIKVLSFLILIGLLFIGGNSYFTFSQTQPKVGGEYTEGLVGAPQFINPILAQTNDVDLDLTALIYNGLLKFDSNEGLLINDLAEELVLSEDQKVYTVKIKNNIYWHDGQKLTVDDILFTFDRIKDVNTKSPLYFNFKSTTIEKIDDNTVRFTLDEAFAPFKESLTVGIIPAHIWSNVPAQNLNLSEFNLKPIGTGPYEFKSFVKDNKTSQIKSYTLVRNDNYFNNTPYIEKLIFKFYSNINEAITALNNKNVEGLAFLPKESQADILNEYAITFNSLSYPQYSALFFNQKENTLLKDVKIKKIISHSINKDKIITDILGSQAQKIDGPILPGSLGYNDEFTKYPYDLEYAKTTLEENGWILSDYVIESEEDTEVAVDNDNENAEATEEEVTEEPVATTEVYPFKVRKKDKTYLEFKLTTVNQTENVEIAKAIQKDLQQVGIKLNLEFFSAEDINREVLKPRKYEILLYGEVIGYDPDPYAFWHSSQVNSPGLNLSLFANREVDTLLEDARKTSDEQTRIDKYKEFQKIMAEQLPAIFLFNPTYTYPQSKKVQNFNAHTIIIPANRFSNIADWYIKTKRTF